MATSFTLAATMAVACQVDLSFLSPDATYFLARTDGSYPVILGTLGAFSPGAGLLGAWVSAVLPAGDYTIADDAGCVPLRLIDSYGNALDPALVDLVAA